MVLSLAPLCPDVERELAARGLYETSQLESPESNGDAGSDRLDTALMTLFRDTGRREVFDALYESSRTSVYEWLRWMLREQQARLDPLDLLQDTFVNVYRYAASFRPESGAGFRRWVRTIAANVVRRARAASPRRWVSATAELAPELEDRQPGPALRLVEGEETRALRTAWANFLVLYAEGFARLSPRDRRALELVELEGRTYAEAAQELGVGSSNMKMIMLRARRRLAAHLRGALGLAPELEGADEVVLEPVRAARASA